MVAPAPKSRTWTVVLQKEEGVPLGAALKKKDGYSLITAISLAGKIKNWNDAHPDKEVRPGDKIVGVNGEVSGHWDMAQSLWRVGPVSLQVERDLSEPCYVCHTHSRTFLSGMEGSSKNYKSIKLASPVDELPYSCAGDCKQEECAICLEDYTDASTRLVVLPCNHAFHPQCAARWFSQHHARYCPLCKQGIDACS